MAKLVEILARELKEWPSGFESILNTQDGLVFGIDFDGYDGYDLDIIAKTDDYERVTRAKWEAERARIAANQQATAEAREISRTGAMTAEEKELADIACGKRSREDQALWDKVAVAAIPALIANPGEWSGDDEAGGEIRSYTDAAKAALFMADAFMAERAKRMKGGV